MWPIVLEKLKKEWNQALNKYKNSILVLLQQGQPSSRKLMKNWPKDMSAQMPRKKKRKKLNKYQLSENRLKTQGILLENTMRKERKVSNCKSMTIESKLQSFGMLGELKDLKYVHSRIMKKLLIFALLSRNGWKVKDIKLRITNLYIHLLVMIYKRKKNKQRQGQRRIIKEKMSFL